MKLQKVLLFTILILIISCHKENQRQKPNNFIEKEIILEDHYDDTNNKFFAKINFFVPAEFDTLQIWTDQSDCTGCETYKYRITTSKSCLIKESGFFKSQYCKDSIDRLTIEHSTVGIDKFKIDSYSLKNIKSRIYDLQRENIYDSKLEKINGRDFIIVRYAGRNYYSPDKDIETLYAITTFAKTLINFNFECRQNDCSNFETKSLNIVKSILIDTIPR
jgi:hypothetical protein